MLSMLVGSSAAELMLKEDSSELTVIYRLCCFIIFREPLSLALLCSFFTLFFSY